MDHLELDHINKLMDDISSSNKNITKHFVISWTIAGLLDANYAPTFRSSDINFGNDIGSCCLKLTLKFSEDMIVMQLITNVVKNSYFLNYRFGFRKKNVLCWHDDHVCNFDENISPTETYKTISNYLSCETKTFEIACQIMLTTCISVPRKRMAHAKTRHDLGICLDFYQIFESEYLSDIILRVGENDVAAHKCILTAKSAVFRKMVEEMGESQNTLVLTETDEDIVRSMLIFMYAGNFQIWETFYSPTIALYECLDKYEITDLKLFLLPVEVTLTDICLVKMSEFSWQLRTASEIEECRPFHRKSPLLRTPFGSFFINVFIENSIEDFGKIIIEPSSVLENMTMNMKLQVLDSDNKAFFSTHLNCSFVKGSEKEVGTSTFVKCDLLTGYIRSLVPTCDSICLGGEIAVSNFEVSHRISSRTKDTKPCDKFADFQLLLDKNIYSDFKFIVEDRVFSVHKAVLGGRSSHFKNLFENFYAVKCITISFIKLSAFENFLIYLYSGKIGDNIETHLDLMVAFDEYSVSILGAQLALLLPHEITLENVCTVLLTLHKLRNADYFDGLKAASFSLICANFNVVEPSPSWENLLAQSPALAREVLLYIQFMYRREKIEE